jgi:hypothetical protein
MRFLAILGLCAAFTAVAYAGDGEGRICEPCDGIDDAISPMDAYQVVEGTTAGTANLDYAYSFCAVQGGTYRFTFCEGGGWAAFDTALSVQGPDNCGPYIVCNDDYCGLQSQVDFYAPMAATYIVVVDGYSSYTGAYGLAYRGPQAPSPVDDTNWGEIKAIFK